MGVNLLEWSRFGICDVQFCVCLVLIVCVVKSSSRCASSLLVGVGLSF